MHVREVCHDPWTFRAAWRHPLGGGGVRWVGEEGWGKGGGITIVFHCGAYVAVAEGGSVVTPPAVTRL